jgi:hypothetical protein
MRTACKLFAPGDLKLPEQTPLSARLLIRTYLISSTNLGRKLVLASSGLILDL